MVTKVLDFINKHPLVEGSKVIFYYVYMFFKNLTETDEKLQIFLSKNRNIDLKKNPNKSYLFCFKS